MFFDTSESLLKLQTADDFNTRERFHSFANIIFLEIEYSSFSLNDNVFTLAHMEFFIIYLIILQKLFLYEFLNTKY